MSVPNQKRITINKEIQPPFTQINNNDMYEAMAILKDSGFKLYMYFAANQDKYVLELSPADIVNKGLMSRASYYNALDNLMNMGYIINDQFYTQSITARQAKEKIKQEIKQTIGR